jgi:ABC-type transport system substrate-binding protein
MRLPGLLLLAILLTGCAGRDQAPQRNTLIDSRDTYDPRSLDPLLATDVPTGRAVSYVFDGLTRYSPAGQLEPALATRWEVSPDGRSYVFHLRTGVRFHDGSPFTSRHVIRSFERVLAPGGTAARSWPLQPIAGAREYQAGRSRVIRGLLAPDDSTVRITLDTALAIFPKLLAMPVASIVPDPVPENIGDRPIGTGPWRLVEWRRDDYLLFARNDDYFDGAPEVDSLLARIIPEASTAVAEFESGRVDLLPVPEAEAARWERDEARRGQLHSAPGLRLWYVAINTTRGPLRDPRVRRALNHAVDVQTIIDRLVGGRGSRAAGVIPPVLDGADPRRSAYAFDPETARRLLAEAGYPDGIDVELWHSQDQTFSRVAQSIQGYLQQVNVRARLVQREGPAVREAARNGQVDLYVKDWFADYPDAENFLYPLLHSANHGIGGNVSFYTNPAYDLVVNRARVEQDERRRIDLYREADAIAFTDAPMIFLLFYDQLFAVQPWISGFEVPTIFTGQRWTRVRITR